MVDSPSVRLPPSIGGYQFLSRLPGSTSKMESEVFIARQSINTSSTANRASNTSKTLKRAAPRDKATTQEDCQFVVVRITPLEMLKHNHRRRTQMERHLLVVQRAQHPHIITAWPSFASDTDLFTVEEFCEYGELFDVVEKSNEDFALLHGVEQRTSSSTVPASGFSQDVLRFSPEGLPASVVLRVFSELMDAVAYCHDVLQICHRDIKLENILLDASMAVKLTGFGMSASIAPLSSEDAADDEERLLMVACGSKHYAAPEVQRGLPYRGSSSDVWSCGIVLFSLVTGGFPFMSDDGNAASETPRDDEHHDGSSNMDTILPTLRSYQLIRDDGVRRLLCGMLDPNPQRRWSVFEVIQHTKKVARLRKS